MIKTVASKNEIISNLCKEVQRIQGVAHEAVEQGQEAARLLNTATDRVRELELRNAELQRDNGARNHVSGALARERENLHDVQVRLTNALEGKSILKREITKLRDPWRNAAVAAAYMFLGALAYRGWIMLWA